MLSLRGTRAPCMNQGASPAVGAPPLLLIYVVGAVGLAGGWFGHLVVGPGLHCPVLQLPAREAAERRLSSDPPSPSPESTSTSTVTSTSLRRSLRGSTAAPSEEAETDSWSLPRFPFAVFGAIRNFFDLLVIFIGSIFGLFRYLGRHNVAETREGARDEIIEERTLRVRRLRRGGGALA